MRCNDSGGGERVYVGCFNDGELYVIDPRGQVEVEAVTVVGRGPFGLAIAPSRQLLFVSNFLENSLAVIDLDPDSPTLYRVIMRIGVR
jgi:YVTN family beta-propeller protein